MFEGDPSRSAIYKDMGNGIAAAGIEYYLPLFLKKLRRCLIMCQSTLTSRYPAAWMKPCSASGRIPFPLSVFKERPRTAGARAGTGFSAR
jgi:hypothetical protein